MEDLKAKSLERAAKFVLGFSHTKFPISSTISSTLMTKNCKTIYRFLDLTASRYGVWRRHLAAFRVPGWASWRRPSLILQNPFWPIKAWRRRTMNVTPSPYDLSRDALDQVKAWRRQNSHAIFTGPSWVNFTSNFSCQGMTPSRVTSDAVKSNF